VQVTVVAPKVKVEPEAWSHTVVGLPPTAAAMGGV